MEQNKKKKTKVGVVKKKKARNGNEYYVLELGNTYAKDTKYRFDAKVTVKTSDGKVTEVENGKLFLSVPQDKDGNKVNITDKFGGKLLFDVQILEDSQES